MRKKQLDANVFPINLLELIQPLRVSDETSHTRMCRRQDIKFMHDRILYAACTEVTSC